MDDPLIRRQAALAAGLSDAELRRRRAKGEWERLGRGAYLDAAVAADLDAVARHRLLIAAALPALDRGAVVSHQSAAVLYDLPLWCTPLDRVHVTRDRRNGGRARSTTVVHCAPVSEIVEVDGYLVTSPARTIIDLARTLGFEPAVACGDAAVREFGVTAGELATELLRATARRGIAQARRVAAFLDGHSESVGESRSRVLFHRAGLSLPLTQVEILTKAGRLLGRVDFFDPEHGVAGEFDGKIKYGRLLPPGQDAGDAVFEEKRREDRLRSEGVEFVRWVWDDLAGPEPVARWRAACARATGKSTPTVRFRQAALPHPRTPFGQTHRK